MTYILGGKEVGSSNKKRYFILALLFVLILAVIGGYLVFKKGIITYEQTNYVIPGVPYISQYNHTGKYGYVGHDPFASSTSMILEYWNPGKNDFDEIRRAFLLSGAEKGNGNLDNMGSIISDLGNLSVVKKKLEIKDFNKYINPQVKTPLLLFLPLSEDQSADNVYYPATLLIGMNDSEKKLTFHSYWYGNNFEMSYDEFNKLRDIMSSNSNGKDYYLVVQPKNLQDSLNKIQNRTADAYPARTRVMNGMEGMMKNYGIGYGHYLLHQYPQARDYFSRVENSAEFNDICPNFLKVQLYYYIGDINLKRKDFEQALYYAKKGIDIDYDLDKPFLDWPGYESTMNLPNKYGIDSRPYELAGDIYLGKNMEKEAQDSYRQALEISPKDTVLKDKNSVVE
jgi:tetratricopeptide (TPR) repeat protein